mgnify:CR=1 FL=1
MFKNTKNIKIISFNNDKNDDRVMFINSIDILNPDIIDHNKYFISNDYYSFDKINELFNISFSENQIKALILQSIIQEKNKLIIFLFNTLANEAKKQCYINFINRLDQKGIGGYLEHSGIK